MSWLWWVLGFGCGGLMFLALIGVIYLMILDRKKTKRVIEEGEHTTGWLVQANTDLFEKGMMDLPALVLISPDKETAKDKEFMTGLAERIMDLKGTDPDDCDDKDEAFVAELMRDETYVEGKWDKLPKRFAAGQRVYLAHIFVYREHLPGERIQGQRLPCAVIWDDPKSPICTRPAPRRERPDAERPREEDDET
jgi:hypothetical protein